MEKTCLVIVDMQKCFINEHTEHLPHRIAAYARSYHFDHIVACRYVNHTNTACYLFENWKKCMKGTPESELVDELYGIPSKIFDKDKYSCWNEEFKSFVHENAITKLIFVGVNTGCCVLHSAFDAYNDLCNCEVVASLCGSTSGESSHAAAVQLLRECITSQRVKNSVHFSNGYGELVLEDKIRSIFDTNIAGQLSVDGDYYCIHVDHVTHNRYALTKDAYKAASALGHPLSEDEEATFNGEKVRGMTYDEERLFNEDRLTKHVDL